jgi:4'-phosphopantetheinyl transferase EntD
MTSEKVLASYNISENNYLSSVKMEHKFFEQFDTTFYLYEADSKIRPIDFEKKLSIVDQKSFERISSRLRKDEFLNTRFLLKSVFNDHEVSREASGRPVFPPPYYGSISHKKGNVVLAVSKSTSHIGVDIEQLSLPLKLTKKIAPKENFEELERQSGLAQDRILALCFSAKESIYKAVSATLETPINFHNVTLVRISLNIGNNKELLSNFDGRLEFSTDHTASILQNNKKISVFFKEILTPNTPYLLTFIKI